MRSTRATAAVARLNKRSDGKHYMVTIMSSGQFKLGERSEDGDKHLSDALSLDDFANLVDSMGPQKVPRITKSEAAFLQQLVKKDKSV